MKHYVVFDSRRYDEECIVAIFSNKKNAERFAKTCDTFWIGEYDDGRKYLESIFYEIIISEYGEIVQMEELSEGNEKPVEYGHGRFLQDFSVCVKAKDEEEAKRKARTKLKKWIEEHYYKVPNNKPLTLD